MRRYVGLLLIVLSACSTAPNSSVGTVAAAPDEADITINALFADGYVRDVDPVIEASLGDTVSLTFVGDITDEIHIHGGYDIFVAVTPATPITFSFVADKLGVFAVELEAAGYLLFELDVG